MVLSLLLAAVGIPTVRHGFLTGKGILPGLLPPPLARLSTSAPDEAYQVSFTVWLPEPFPRHPWCLCPPVDGWASLATTDYPWQSSFSASTHFGSPQLTQMYEGHISFVRQKTELLCGLLDLPSGIQVTTSESQSASGSPWQPYPVLSAPPTSPCEAPVCQTHSHIFTIHICTPREQLCMQSARRQSGEKVPHLAAVRSAPSPEAPILAIWSSISLWIW